MYFTLAVSAATAARCAALAGAALGADPRIMPIPGPAEVAWRAPDERAVLLVWGRGQGHGRSHAGTIWAEGTTVCARTGLARVDPVYLAEPPGAVVVSDLSAFENAGWPDPRVTAVPVQAGGHGGELLRGGYAQAAWP